MSTIIRTRSPFFIRTQEETDADLNYFEATILIYQGDVTPTIVCGNFRKTITLSKKVLENETSVTFEISEIINQYLKQTYNQAALQSIWARVTTRGYKADATALGNPNATTYLAQEGFNTFREGVNFTNHPDAMITTNHIQIKKGDAIRIPINAETVSSVTFKAGSSNISVITPTDNGDSNQKIQYVSATNNTIDSVVVRNTANATRQITIEQIEECKYSPIKCVFLNRWGAFQDVYFFKKTTSSLESRNETFNKSIFAANTITSSLVGGVCTPSSTYNSYSVTDHPRKTFNANAKESLILNTGFIKESMNSTFQELLVSEYVWLVIGVLSLTESNIHPVVLKDSNLQTKTSLNDRLINYTMNFEMSFDYINNIR